MSSEDVTQVQPHDRVLLITVLKSSLDENSTNQLVDDVQTAAVQTPRVPIVLDFARVRFAPSVALGALMKLGRSFQFDSRRLALVQVDRRVRGCMTIVHLDNLLEIHDTVDQVK